MKNYFITKNKSQELYGLNPMTMEQLVKALEGEKLLACDVETQNLSPFRDNAQLLMIQISDPKGNNYVIDAQSTNILKLKDIFASEDVEIIFFNGKFDCKWLKYFKIPVENVFCSFLAEKIIHCGKDFIKYSLKDVLKRYKNIDISKEEQSSFIGHSGVFDKSQVLYGISDTKHLIDIRSKQLAEIGRLELENVLRLENEALLAFTDIEFNGMKLDKSAWEALAETAKIRIDEILPKMDALLVEEFPQFKSKQTTMFEERPTDINWNSPKKVLAVFQNVDPTLTGVGAPVLAALDHPLIKIYKEYKESMKLYNTYGIDFYKHLDDDGIARTNFSQILNTGRISSSNPNIQNLPAQESYRNCFIPEKEGHVFVSSDFSSQELAIIAFGSQDPVWLKILRTGGDLHSTCAELVFKDKWHDTSNNSGDRKKLRNAIKAINFGLAYGMGAQGLGNRLQISTEQAEKLIEEYFNTFPKIRDFLTRLGEYGKNSGLIRTYRPYRRLRSFSKWKGILTDRTDMGSIVRASKNTPIQGSGADQVKTALVMLRKIIKENNYPVKIVATVHDQIDCTCPDEFSAKWGEILSETMEEAASINTGGERLIKCDVTTSLKWSKG